MAQETRYPEFDRVADLLKDVVWILEGESYAPAYVNDSARELYGADCSQLITDQPLRWNLVHPEDRDRLMTAYQHADTLRSSQIRYRLIRPDGQERFVDERILLVSEPDSSWPCIVAVTSDRTDEQRAKSAIREAKDETAEQTVLHLVEMARKNDMLQQELYERKRAERVTEVLTMVSERLNLASSPREAAIVILEAADELFTWDAAIVDVYSADSSTFYGIVRYDLVDGKRTSVSPQPGGVPFTKLRRKLFDEGPILLLRKPTDTPADENLVPFGEASRPSASLMFAPITKGERKGGLISIQSYTPGIYNEKDLELFQVLANYCCTGLERTFAEERLNEMEQRLKAMSEQSPIVQWTTNTELRITSFTPRNLSGSREIAAGIEELVSGEGSRDFLEAHLEALEGHPVNCQVRLFGRSCQCRIEVLRTPSGEISGCLGTGTYTDS